MYKFIFRWCVTCSSAVKADCIINNHMSIDMISGFKNLETLLSLNYMNLSTRRNKVKRS